MNSFHRLCFIPLFLFALLVAGVVLSLVFRLSVQDMLAALSSQETFFALRLTLFTSVAAIFAAILLGIPSGYLLSRRSFPGKSILDTFLDLPLVMTPLVAGVGLLFLFGQTGIGKVLSQWGIYVIFTPTGAIVAQLFIAAPIVIRSSKAAFETIDPGYEWAGQVMGLTPARVFLLITLPMAGRGLVSGIVLGWARAIGEFGATLMVAGGTRMKTETLPIAVYLNISSGELGVALSCAWILMITGFLLLLLLRCFSKESPPNRHDFVADAHR